jgi:hypothetical protein
MSDRSHLPLVFFFFPGSKGIAYDPQLKQSFRFPQVSTQQRTGLLKLMIKRSRCKYLELFSRMISPGIAVSR